MSPASLNGPALFRIRTGRWKENCWIVSDADGTAVVVDPGDDPESIAREVESRQLRVEALLATHGHHDHIAAVAALAARWNTGFLLHPADAPMLRRMNFFRKVFDGAPAAAVPVKWDVLVPGTTIGFGSLKLDVLATPGHSPGSVSFHIGDCLLLGDVLLPAGIGRTDLPGGDRGALDRSLLEISGFPPDWMVYPGHGDPFPLSRGLELIGMRKE